ncbi:tRNA 2-selenouridine(34) synthase MnmH [Marinospirillum perlucidum]|uniref:tRNA 2-selenouridine(34) synthase MnmH n=1 Tax=Marinospirillum perlucidum TaxID=1982602 RepID=UPI000DF380EA|nr:tRNA 2-selenouridine(34) synthase MnmH [Marinospirillum perlucidum]
MTRASQLYRELFMASTPLMDTRAPVEFNRGSFPTAENLPLMTDDERAQVGTCYKQKGQEAAIKLGHQLVQGATKQARVEAWIDFTRRHPEGYLFCFRGGLRSQLVQQWLADAGVHYPRVPGGYKALRRYLLDTSETLIEAASPLLLGGMTGTGKTELLPRLPGSIDLEGLAHHRGSSFGRHASGQPTQINFENQLALALLKQQHQGSFLILEDENPMIGRLALPRSLYLKMQKSPLVLLEAPREERIERLLQEYVIKLQQEFIDRDGQLSGPANFGGHLQAALGRIRKRLGSENYLKLLKILQEALACPDEKLSLALHRRWIEGLLDRYYDPMYHYHEQQKSERLIFRGSATEVQAFLQARNQPSHPLVNE